MEAYTSENKIHNMEDIDLSGTYTYADYLRWELDERLELIRGKIFTMSPAPANTASAGLDEKQVKPVRFLPRLSMFRLPRTTLDDHQSSRWFSPTSALFAIIQSWMGGAASVLRISWWRYFRPVIIKKTEE